MPLPGSEVQIIDELPAGAVSTPIGTGFIAALSDRGPIDRPAEIRSVGQLGRVFGPPATFTELHGDAEAFFGRGGERLIIIRVVGPAATAASGELSDGSSGDALSVTAANPGGWGNSLTVDFTYDAGDITAAVKLDGTVVEVSGERDGKPGITEWSLGSRFVRITDGGGGNPTSATVTLTGGTDDRNSITDTHWADALDLLAPELGPGQVAIPNISTTAVHTALLKHAAENNRFALLDGVNDSGNLLTAAGVARATGNGRYGTMVAPTVSGASGVPFVMGRIAYTDRAAGPGQYAAGADYGELGNVTADIDYTDSVRQELNEAGVQVIRNMYGRARIYGFRTLASSDSPYVEAAHARVLMSLRSDLEAVIEQYVMRKIDGRGLLFAQLDGALTAVCQRYYSAPRNDLYGETPADAFRVDTGPAVNTPETIASGELRAAVAVRVSPGAERVILTLTKAALADTL